jgi:phospholipid/cholesterol/gamma-HCH transport system ATP-binding protein
MSDLKIKVRGLKKAFGPKQVLNGIDLDVPRGQSLVVIGGSGSGKSVLIKCILGLVEPDSGSIEIDGQEVIGMKHAEREEIMRKFGMLFQGAALFDSLRGMARKAAKEVALRKLAAVGLGPEVGELFPAELSGGMQKRVSLARAIAVEPEIIFFDEPTTGLDPIMAQVINELIVKCVKSLGATALSITHDMHSLRAIADKAAMIYEGRIIWSGDAKEIDHSGNAHVEQFVQGRAEGPIRMPVRPL